MCVVKRVGFCSVLIVFCLRGWDYAWLPFIRVNILINIFIKLYTVQLKEKVQGDNSRHVVQHASFIN